MINFMTSRLGLLVAVVLALWTTTGCSKNVGSDGCSVRTVAGGVQIDCPDTSQFLPNGVDGVNATPTKAIQFCAGTSGYTNFLEVGLCIDNKIYAVYSGGVSALVYLAPGTYNTSTPNGTNCCFEVQPNCVVVRH